MIFVRTDGSPIIGMGHVMRCLAIAQEIRQLGEIVAFIISNTYAVDIIRENHFDYWIISERDNILEEIPEYTTFFPKKEKNTILVDSYKASDDYLNQLSKLADVYFIDGMLRCNADIAGVICFNPSADLKCYEDRYTGRKTILLIGNRYVPLRSEFKIRLKHNSFSKKKILLTTGSTDNHHITETFCSHWNKSKNKDKADLHVIIGSLFKETQYISNYPNIYFHRNVHNMSMIMKDTDVAICQAGTTVFELLSQGIPTVSFAINDIQQTFSSLEPKIRWAGVIEEDCKSSSKIISDILLMVSDLLEHQETMEKMKSEISACFDGEGAARIASTICNNSNTI